MTNSTPSGNTAPGGDGGGIFNGGTLAVTTSTLSNNSGSNGGGIANSSGTVTVISSTISGNTATSDGGGVFSDAFGTLTMTNSTISGNSAAGAGGGIYNGRTLTLTNGTITNNTSTVHIGDGIFNQSTLNLTNAIIAGNSGNNTDGNSPATNSHALIGGTPLLGALGNYGGPTQTVPLLPGSPAISAGDAAVCANTIGTAPVGGVDQRGVSRPSGSCDIGAFQSQGFSLAEASGDDQSATISTAFAYPLVVTVSSSHSEPVAGGVVTFTGPGLGAGIQTSPLTATIVGSGQASVSVTAATVQTVLNGLSSIGGAGGSVTVTLSGSTYTVTFGGTLADSPQPAIIATPALTPASITGTSNSIGVINPTPSTVTLSFPSVPNGLNGWFTGAVGSVTADDSSTSNSAISSVTCTNATVAALPATPGSTVTLAVTATTDGAAVPVSCTATNALGVSGTSNTVTLKLDATQPVLTASAKKADNSAYTANTLTNQVVTVTCSCTDATSGALTGPVSPQTFRPMG